MSALTTPWNYESEIQSLSLSGADLEVANSFLPALGDHFLEIQAAFIAQEIVYRSSAEASHFKLVSEIAESIQELRPVTLSKLRDASWVTQLGRIANDLPYYYVQTSADMELVKRRMREAVKVPGFTIDGLPGFSYPTEILPPLMKIEAGRGTDLPSTPDGFRDNSSLSYNYNYPSRIFGDPSTIGDRFTSSPLKVKKGWSCLEGLGGLNIPSIGMSFPGGIFSDLGMFGLGNPSISVQLPPCVAQVMPPMFMPRNSISLLSLGDGTELGFIEEGLVKLSNFGSGFKSAIDKVSPLVEEAMDTVKDAYDTVNKVVGEATKLAGEAIATANGYIQQVNNLPQELWALGADTVQTAIGAGLGAAGELISPVVDVDKLFNSKTAGTWMAVGGAIGGTLFQKSTYGGIVSFGGIDRPVIYPETLQRVQAAVSKNPFSVGSSPITQAREFWERPLW